MRIEHWLYTVPLRLKSIFRGGQVERELAEELRVHLEYKIEEGIAKGLSPHEARLAALRAMDGLDQRKEEMRDARRIHWLTDCVDDTRYAIRSLRRTVGLTAFVAVTLALGIGMSTASFSMVDGLILRPYPVPHPGNIVSLVSTTRDNGFDDAHQHGCDDGATDAAEPTKHDDREQSRDQVVVAAGIERIKHRVDGSRCSRGADAEPEGECADTVGVHAEQLCGGRVLNSRSNRAAEPRACEQEVEENEHRDRESEREDAYLREAVAGDRPRRVRVGRLARPVGRLVDGAEHALDAEGERPGDQQRELLRLLAAQRTDEDELHADAECEHERRDDQHRQERIDLPVLEQGVAQVRTQDDECALSYVDHPHHAENQREAARHQRIDASGEDPEDAGLDDEVHCVRVSRPMEASARSVRAARPSADTPGRACPSPIPRAGPDPGARRSSSSEARLPPWATSLCATR